MAALKATRAAGREAEADQNALDDAMAALEATGQNAAERKADTNQNALDDAMAALETTRQKAAGREAEAK